jgi:circadian clock protein KaiC
MAQDLEERDGRDAVQTVPTGIPGLDTVLNGGLTSNRVYLVEGEPGAGKTTLGLQYLLAGAARGERGLYVTLSETREELLAVAASHGWAMDSIAICELIASEDSLKPEEQYTVFDPAEVELSETVNFILKEVERVKPQRLVFDSLSELRLLTQNALRYRHQVLALKQFFVGRACTVLLLDDRTSELGDLQLRSIAHGVINLEQSSPVYGAVRRRIELMKMRGRQYSGGYHDFEIVPGGLQVYPRLVAQEHPASFVQGQLSSDVDEIDCMLHGGVDRGTSTLLMGPAGSGKSTLALRFAVASCARGERSAVFAFDERVSTLTARMRGLGLDISAAIDSGLMTIHQIDPAELSPGQLAGLIQRVVEPAEGPPVSVIVIDSLNGYLQSMPEERFLIIQLHELLTYVGQHGVATFLVVAQHGLMGMAMATPVDATYLADTVIVLRYFETMGRVRQAVSVVKRRSGPHEHSIRELMLGPEGIQVGAPLEQFQGILSGFPAFNVASNWDSGGRHWE